MPMLASYLRLSHKYILHLNILLISFYIPAALAKEVVHCNNAIQAEYPKNDAKPITEIQLSVPSIEQFFELRDDAECVLKKTLVALKRQPRFGYAELPIRIDFVVSGRITQTEWLDPVYNWEFSHNLMTARLKANPREKLDIRDTQLSMPRLIEHIHYGLFNEAKTVRDQISGRKFSRSVYEAIFFYSLWSYSDRYGSFLPNHYPEVGFSRIEKTSAGRMVRNKGNYSVIIRPEWLEAFTALMDGLGGLYTARASSDMKKVTRIYGPASPVLQRLNQNLWRFINNLPPILAGTPVSAPVLEIDGVLYKTEIVSFDDFLWEAMAIAGYRKWRTADANSQLAGIESEVIKSWYTYHDHNGRENSHIIFSWSDSVPEGWSTKIKRVAPSNPILQLAPPLSEPPKDLESAMRASIQYWYK